MKGILLAVLVVLNLSLSAQTIVTYVGGGTGGLGIGGPATAAVIDDPAGNVVDKYGNFYFVQDEEHIVSKVDVHGIITTVAGTGTPGYNGDGIPATAADLNFPSDVKVDTNGNIYICDHQNSRIRKVDVNTGIISTIAGTGTHGFSGDGGPATSANLNYPAYLCFDSYNNLYIADVINYRIRVVNALGVISTYAGSGIPGRAGDGGPATAGQMEPVVICMDVHNNLYISDISVDENRVARVDYSTGIISTYAGTDTGYVYNGDGFPATAANIQAGGIAIDTFGNLYISDSYNNRLRKVDTSGIIQTFAGTGIGGFGGDGGPATSSEINDPEGLSFDKCGNLYMSDIGNARVRKIIINPSCSVDSLVALEVNKIRSNSQISIYPNPVYDELTITSGNGIQEVSVIDLLGQLVEANSFGSNAVGQVALNVKMAGLQPGVYLIRVTEGDGNVIVTKVLKE